MEHKIVITGTMGAGKTTAIGQISEIDPVLTDVANSKRRESDKATTTAAFDYGEVDLGDGDVVRIYGTPGQERFEFMWPVLARGALGIVYLVDNSRDNPIADLERFMQAFGRHARDLPSVVAVNRIDGEAALDLSVFEDFLAERDLPWPALEIDARQRDDVLDVIELLLSQEEADSMEVPA